MSNTTSSEQQLLIPSSSVSRKLSRSVSEIRDGIVNQRDLIDIERAEKDCGDASSPGQMAEGQETGEKLVTWDGPDDPENPKNWPLKKKWFAAITGMSTTLATL
jgi:hypothetical protein